MGEAKRKKQRAARAQAAAALVQSIGLPLPPPMTDNPDPAAVQMGFKTAAALLQDLLKAKDVLASKAEERVNYLLGLLRDVIYPSFSACSDELVSGLKVECRKGCAWCCHQNVEVTIPEAIWIAVETGHSSDPRGAPIDRAAERWANLDDIARAKTGEPCPFLREDHACSIYDIRPIACRAFLSPDAAGCRAAYEKAVTGDMTGTVTSHGMPQVMGTAHRVGIDGLLKEIGLQYDDVDLVSTVAAIRRDPSLIEKWVAGEHVFKARPSRRLAGAGPT